jgi:hypothetical protein
MIRLYKKDHTDKNITTWQWLCANSDQIEKQTEVSTRAKIFKLPALLEFKHDFDIENLAKDIDLAKEKYGDYGWMSKADPTGSEKPYHGFGLTWNPNHIYEISEHQSVLGNPEKTNFGHVATTTGWGQGEPLAKDNNTDTYSLVKRTRASEFGSIGNLLNNVKRTLVKSRISTIDGTFSSMRQDRPFHRDAPLFTGTRINIPIETAKPYVFDLESLNEPVHLKTGHAYSWDTNVLHRVISMRPCTTPRTHIVINVSPWWDYNSEEEYWQTNEFYGQLHPLEMVLDGHIMKGLTAV